LTASRSPVRRLARAAALGAILALGAGCSRYAQDTPEAVLADAKEMIRSGHAERLPDLIYADSKEMRELLTKLGEVLGTLQDLGTDVQKRFPAEIAELRQQAEEAARRGESSNFIQRFAGQAIGGNRRTRRLPADPQQAEQMRSGLDMLMKQVFADPYGWLADAEGKLTVSRTNMPEDMAAILWDGKPIMGVGITLKQEGGLWYVMLPTSIPGIGTLAPKSAESWEIMGALLEVFDNMLSDLRDDVRAGRIARLEDLASKAGEKAFIPAALCILAYEKVRQAERKQQRAAAVGPSGSVGGSAK
jgi:hypothetical protein